MTILTKVSCRFNVILIKIPTKIIKFTKKHQKTLITKAILSKNNRKISLLDVMPSSDSIHCYSKRRQHKSRPGEQEDSNMSAVFRSLSVPMLIFEALNVKELWHILIRYISQTITEIIY